MNASTPSLAGRVVYWIATGVVAALFVVPGVANLVRVPHIAHDMAHLGYPDYFMSILGTWKLLAAIAILIPGFPRLKEWAYAGMIFDLTGAAISRAIVGDGTAPVLVPLCIALVAVVSWVMRPPARILHVPVRT